MDAFGNTALRHLVSWPEGLSLVLNRLGESVLRLYDQDQTSALECALIWSGFICANQKSTMCPEACSCATTVKILLENDDECISRAVARPHMVDCISRASARAQELVVDVLKHLRDELKAFSCAHMKPKDIDRLALESPEPLDQHISEVLRILNNQSVTIPARLSTELRDRCCQVCPSIYHWLRYSKSISLADLFYSRGFHAVDLHDEQKFTPLARIRGRTSIIWLIQHGASLKAQLPNKPVGYTTAHHVFRQTWSYAEIFGSKRCLGLFKALSMFELDTRLTARDTCRCACSGSGCHPYTTMVGAIGNLVWSPEGFRRKLSEQFAAIEHVLDIPRDTKSLCIRACTFAALDLRHTCCARGKEYEKEEIEEMWEEDSTALELLEALLIEFDESLDQMGCSLTEFLTGVWNDRMRQVLIQRESQTLTGNEIEGARNLGVWLRVPKEEEWKGSEEDFRGLAYWARQLDDAIE